MSLYNNYMSILTIESGQVSQDTDGSLDWKGGKAFIESFKNLKCHIQETERKGLITKYGKPELDHMVDIYHRSTALLEYIPISETIEIKEHTGLRIVTMVNPRKAIQNFSGMERHTYEVFTVFGHIHQIKGAGSRAGKFYILKTQRNNRFDI